MLVTGQYQCKITARKGGELSTNNVSYKRSVPTRSQAELGIPQVLEIIYPSQFVSYPTYFVFSGNTHPVA
jgi:hypothetical protein